MIAYVTPERRTTWREYDAEADAVAADLCDLEPGSRIGVLLPDSEQVHVALLATERAGLVAAGLGWPGPVRRRSSTWSGVPGATCVADRPRPRAPSPTRPLRRRHRTAGPVRAPWARTTCGC